MFCSSLADWLDDEVPVEWLVDLLDLIRRTPNLDWLLLAKRPENWKTRIQDAMWHSTGKVEPEFINNDGFKAGNPILEFCRLWLEGEAPTNVWIGTTVEDQERADERIPFLRAIPAKVRFLSCEPLLGQVDLRTWLGNLRPDPIHWVICGGESGTNARPMHPDWARSLRDQCKAAGVPFFFKQWGEWSPLVGAHFEKSASEGALAGWQSAMEKRGKLRAGRLLDGVEHNNFPEVAR